MKVMSVDSNLNIVINNSICETDIIPKEKIEMWRKILVKGKSVVEGSIFAGQLEIDSGSCVFNKAVFLKDDIRIIMNSPNCKNIFLSNVQTERSIYIENKRDDDSYTLFEADIYSDNITLDRCFVYGNIYARNIKLTNSVVLGGVIADKTTDISNSIVGSIKTESMLLGDNVTLLYPLLVLDQHLKLNDNLRVLFLDSDEKISGHTIKLTNKDKRIYSEEGEKDKYVFGTGMRVLNLNPVKFSFDKNLEIIANKLLKYQETNDKEKDQNWELLMLNSVGKVEDLEIKGSFSLRNIK